VRTILRAILAIALLLGSGVADWAPVQAQAHEACCCGTPAGAEDTCPCPKPENNRTPSSSLCSNRVITIASPAIRRTLAERRTEPRPEPATWAEAKDDLASVGSPASTQGREPDLGRHLAQLGTFRI